MKTEDTTTYQLISLLEGRLLHMESVGDDPRKRTIVEHNL
jgi:hypothetical protein